MTSAVAWKINCRRLRTEARDQLKSTAVVHAMESQGWGGGGRGGGSSRDREVSRHEIHFGRKDRRG